MSFYSFNNQNDENYKNYENFNMIENFKNSSNKKCKIIKKESTMSEIKNIINNNTLNNLKAQLFLLTNTNNINDLTISIKNLDEALKNNLITKLTLLLNLSKEKIMENIQKIINSENINSINNINEEEKLINNSTQMSSTKSPMSSTKSPMSTTMSTTMSPTMTPTMTPMSLMSTSMPQMSTTMPQMSTTMPITMPQMPVTMPPMPPMSVTMPPMSVTMPPMSVTMPPMSTMSSSNLQNLTSSSYKSSCDSNKSIFVDLTCFIDKINKYKEFSNDMMIDLDLLASNIKTCAYEKKNLNNMSIKEAFTKIDDNSNNDYNYSNDLIKVVLIVMVFSFIIFKFF
jgi:hypothetical protein